MSKFAMPTFPDAIVSYARSLSYQFINFVRTRFSIVDLLRTCFWGAKTLSAVTAYGMLVNVVVFIVLFLLFRRSVWSLVLGNVWIGSSLFFLLDEGRQLWSRLECGQLHDQRGVRTQLLSY